MDYTVGPFQFGGHEIRCVVAELPQTVELDLENILSSPLVPGSRGPTGTAKLIVLQQGLKSLVVDGKTRPLVHRNARGEEEMVIPNIRDRESRRSLLDRLLRIVVEKNDWLCYVEPFSEVFSDYAPEDAPKEDPTGPPPEQGSPDAGSSMVTSTYSESTHAS